jgi:hypothetical protein
VRTKIKKNEPWKMKNEREMGEENPEAMIELFVLFWKCTCAAFSAQASIRSATRAQTIRSYIRTGMHRPRPMPLWCFCRLGMDDARWGSRSDDRQGSKTTGS